MKRPWSTPPASNPAWGTATLMIALLWGLTGCSPSEQQAIEGYQKQVLSALGRTPVFEDTLGELVALTIGDLGCDENLCASTLRFQYLTEFTPQRRVQVADYQGKVCQNKDLAPPASLRAQHDLLCDTLDALFKALDAIETNARVAMTVAQVGQSSAESAAADPLRQELVNRIDAQRAKMIEIQAALKGIAWLQPVL